MIHKKRLGAAIVVAFIVAAPYAAFLVSQQQKQTDTHAATVCSISPLLVNSCHPWLGGEASNYGGIANNPKDQVLGQEGRIGRQLNMVHTYHPPGTNSLNASDMYFINRANTILEADWIPDGGSFAAAGSPGNNVNIDKMAASIKSVAPKKIIFSIWHEPENDASTGMSPCTPSGKGRAGSPADFAAMYRYIHDRMVADGVNNVVWAINYMGAANWDKCINQFWPGNSYVDWIFWDPYAHSGSFDSMAGRFYNVLTADTDASHAYTSKVWGIAEWNIYWSGMSRQSQIDLYNSARTSIDNNTWPRLKAFEVFDSLDQSIACFPSSNKTQNPPLIDAGLLAAYKNYASSPHFTDAFYGTTAPPPPSDTTPPTVSITSPANGAAVSGTLNVTAAASDSGGIAKVVFSVDGTVIATDAAQPYAVNVDTTKYTNTNHTITATAYDAAGNSKPAQIGVVIQNITLVPPAKPTLTADKSAVQAGGSVLLSWSAAGAASCILTPGNIFSAGASGSKLVANLRQTTTYTITCSNSKGKSAASLQVVVSAKPPVTTPAITSFTATPSAITTGATSTLHWAASNVATNGCAITPGPLSSTSANGQWQTPVLTASVSYTITCKDAGGKIASKFVSITVNGAAAPAPPAADAPSSTPTSASVVRATGGQQVVNAESDDTVNQGQLVSLDPSNVTDPKKAANILRIEYYNGGKLLQTVSSPPYALNTKALPPGTYAITERTYYDDGSDSERTQDITVRNTAAVASKKVHTSVAVMLGFIILAGALVVYARKIKQSRTRMPTAAPAPDPGGVIVSPQVPQQPPQAAPITPDDPNHPLPPAGAPL